MKKIIRMMGLVGVLLFVLTGCNAPIYNVQNAQVGMKKEVLSNDDIYKTIVEGAEKVSWKITRVDENNAVGIYHVRVHEAKVDINFDTKKYHITYKGGINLSYNYSNKTIHENYNKWVAALEGSIREELMKLN